MQTFKIVALLLAAAILGVVAMVLIEKGPRIQLETPSVDAPISTFAECAAAGNPIMESYPRQCRTKDGRLFVEPLSEMPGAPTPPSSGNGACAIAGCSGQLCVSSAEAAAIVSTCEYRAEYACYRTASCEVQRDGSCGWTLTAELRQCLASPPEFEGDELQVM